MRSQLGVGDRRVLQVFFFFFLDAGGIPRKGRDFRRWGSRRKRKRSKADERTKEGGRGEGKVG